MALVSPFPTIVQAAGNGDADEYVNHKGYNSLTVGNHNDDATTMAADSVFRNPNTEHGDRELPELTANGTVVTAVGVTGSGTSFAAPAVAGTVAVLQEIDDVLKSWPEGNRAILLASATQNVSGSTWLTDVNSHVDARDGAGALNAEEAVEIAGNYQYPDNTASRRGWEVGALNDSSFDENHFSTFLYNIQVPSTGSTHVKIALAWDSRVDLDPVTFEPNNSVLAMDLDLEVYDENEQFVAYSASFDNSYEIAEFEGTANQTYAVRIYRAIGEGEFTYYGLAWTVN